MVFYNTFISSIMSRDRFFEIFIIYIWLITLGNQSENLKNVGYPEFGFAYFPLGFAHKGDQRRSKREQDRTQRALSNALFTFPLTPPQAREKSKILSKNNEKNATHLVNPTTIRPLRGPKLQTYLDR